MSDKKENGFFTESNGCRSMMRLLSLILVCAGCIIVAGAIWFKLDGAHYGLELAILGVIGKGYQKNVEVKNKPNETTDPGTATA